MHEPFSHEPDPEVGLSDLDEETDERVVTVDDEDNEATIVRPLVIVVEDDEDNEATFVRPLAAVQDELDEATTVVDREPIDATIVVERAAPEDGTALHDGAAVHDGTVLGERARPTVKKPGASAPSRRAKRRITLPPVEPGFGREAVDASGPGAITSYEPRAIPEQPAVTPAVELGPDASRATAPSMPSVGKRSRRLGLIGIVGFGVACVLSVTGVVFLAVLLFGG